MRTPTRVLTVLTSVLALGCVPMMGQRHTEPIAARVAVSIEVTNKNFEDLVVYWRKGEIDVPLGVAPGMTTRQFVVHPALLGDGLGVQLAIGPRGQRASRVSWVFDAAHGARVSWIVDPKLEISTLVVH